MKYVTKQNAQVGDKVLVPLNNEWMHDEQLMYEHEVVLALKCNVPPDEQVVGVDQDPLPAIQELNDDIAIFK